MDNDFDRKAFGKQLVDLRSNVEHKKTRSEVANGLEVSIPTLMSWEKGDSEPSASKIAKLCEYYKVSADYLLLRTTDRHGVADSILASQPEQTEPPSEPEQPSPPEQAVQPSEPESTSPVEQPVQPAEPEQPSPPEQAVQPSVPFCKDCPLVATVQSLSTAVTLALSRK